jgi:tetratricopeptide (TPR) repeat protein
MHLKVGAVNGDWLWVTHRKAGWISRKDVVTLDEAIVRFSEQIRLAPQDSEAHNARGLLWNAKGEYDIAIRDFNDAIALNPNNAAAYGNRAVAWRRKGDCDQAVADYTAAIRLNPHSSLLYRNRGIAERCRGAYAAALTDFEQAIRTSPDHAEGYNSRAWLLATCPDEDFRDGEKAVLDAKKACALTGWKSAEVLGTLAAAYAEQGNFEEAIAWQTKAHELASEDEKLESSRVLEQYRAGVPHREVSTANVAQTN